MPHAGTGKYCIVADASRVEVSNLVSSNVYSGRLLATDGTPASQVRYNIHRRQSDIPSLSEEVHHVLPSF